MQKPPPAGVGFVSAGADETAAVVEEVDDRGPSRVGVRVEAPPAFAGTRP